MGIINEAFEFNVIHIHTKITVHKTSARSVLICGSKAWTVCKRDESRIKGRGMKFMRKAGCTAWEYTKSLDIMKELKIHKHT
jgi:hypothetical protein